jgi:hypothetical protein
MATDGFDLLDRMADEIDEEIKLRRVCLGARVAFALTEDLHTIYMDLPQKIPRLGFR